MSTNHTFVDLADKLDQRADGIEKQIASCQIIIDLLKSQMDLFDDRPRVGATGDAPPPFDLYTVRMSVDHGSSIRTLTKELAELRYAAAALRIQAERTSI